MADGGVGYFGNGYWHTGYWHTDYWADAGAVPPPPLALFTPIGLDRAAGHLVVREQAPGQIVAEER